MSKKSLFLMFFMIFMLLFTSINTTYAKGYLDINKHWAKEYIILLTDKGIISGYPDGTFKPDDNITVAEFAKLVLVASEIEIVGSKPWYKSVIEKAMELRLIKSGEFDNYDKRLITRGEMARMIARQIGEDSPKAEKTSFKDDNEIPDSLKRYIKVVSDKQIDAGAVHTVVLNTDGTVWSCGWNIFGTLGNETNEDSHTPVQAKGLNNITTISAGFFHTVALKKDGTVWSWGGNWYGQLGNGTENDSIIPVRVLIE